MQSESKAQVWNQLQENLSALVEELLGSNAALHSRLDEVNQELAVWRRAERSSREELEAAQRKLASQAINARYARSRSAHPAERQQDKPLVSVILDGDGALFQPQYLSAGRDGGRTAASKLRSAISEHAKQKLGREPDQLVVNIFLNASGLSQALMDNNICDAQRFAEFVLGFNAAHPLLNCVDCGKGKEGADAKIREHLRLYAGLPNCGAVYAAISHDGGYATSLAALRTEGLLDKVTLVKSYSEIAHELKFLNLPMLELPELFMQKKLVTSWKSALGNKPAKVEQTLATPAKTPAKPATAPAAPAPKAAPAKDKVKLRKVDPRVPLHQNTPPPCNRFYLSKDGCKKPGCPFCHDYDLSEAQLETLAEDAKKSPCFFVIRGLECPEFARHGNCLMGHVCPRGKDCPFGERCRFNKPGMHPGTAVASSKATPSAKKTANGGSRKPPPLSSSPSDTWTSESDEDILLQPTPPRNGNLKRK